MTMPPRLQLPRAACDVFSARVLQRERANGLGKELAIQHRQQSTAVQRRRAGGAGGAVWRGRDNHWPGRPVRWPS